MKSEITGQRRRSRRRQPLPPGAAEAEAFLDALLVCYDQEAGSDAAIAAAQKALFYAWQAVAPLIGGIGTLSPLDQAKDSVLARRAEMAKALGFLSGAGVASEVAARLLVGIEELPRGVLIPELEPAPGKRRGGRVPSRNLPLMQVAVEAAEAVIEENRKRDAIDNALKKCGTNRRTVRDWRKLLEAGPTQFRPRKFSILAWGDLTPDYVLWSAVKAIKAL